MGIEAGHTDHPDLGPDRPVDGVSPQVPELKILRRVAADGPAAPPERKSAIPPSPDRRPAVSEAKTPDSPVSAKELGAVAAKATVSAGSALPAIASQGEQHVESNDVVQASQPGDPATQPKMIWGPGKLREAVRQLHAARPDLLSNLPEDLQELAGLLINSKLTQKQIAADLHCDATVITKKCGQIMRTAEKAYGDNFPTDLPKPDVPVRPETPGLLSTELRRYAQQSGLSSKQLAEYLECTPSTVVGAIGGRSYPPISFMRDLMRKIGMPEEDITERLTQYRVERLEHRNRNRGYHPRGPGNGWKRHGN